MKVIIRNCNNIDSAEVELMPAHLNIKYALNGTGKSTIARAIEAFVNHDEEEKKSLVPFKYANAPEDHAPSVQGIDDIKSIKIFNESYVERFVFTPEALFPDTFNVFVKTQDYETRMATINKNLQKIHSLFESNEKIKDLLRSFDGFVNGFGRSVKSLAKASPIAKGIAKGNVVVNIPAGLECFAAYIQSEMRNDWIKWHSDGDGYLPLQKNCCPYCAQELDGVEDRVKLVAQKYDANSVKHLVNMVTVFKELAKEGLSTEASDFVKNVTTNAEGFGNEDAERLMGIKRQVDLLSQKLRTLQAMNFYTERDDPAKIKDKLNGLRLDSSKFVELRSAKVDEVIAVVNETIDSALVSVDELQQEVAAQQKRIADEIKKYDTHINAFMELAGYPYRVSIVDLGNEEYKTLLSHVDLPGEGIHEPKSHLSYGERNAFALSLFVYDAIHSDPDLVVLDDPISSFDGNKKFALLKMMFWDLGWETLSGRTVLMLTHDFCPVIDVTWTFSKDFPASPVAWYLKCMDGCMTEERIKKRNVHNAVSINKDNAKREDKDVLIRIVHCRKWLELKGEVRGHAHDLVSNVEHLRAVPEKRNDAGVWMPMPADEIAEGLATIRECITDFDYDATIARASNVAVLKVLYDGAQCSFEKVLIFRYMVMAYKQRKGVEPVLDGIIRKYMNEPFHIENDYVYQLNPYKYDLIPDSEIRLFDAKVDDLLS